MSDSTADPDKSFDLTLLDADDARHALFNVLRHPVDIGNDPHNSAPTALVAPECMCCRTAELIAAILLSYVSDGDPHWQAVIADPGTIVASVVERSRLSMSNAENHGGTPFEILDVDHLAEALTRPGCASCRRLAMYLGSTSREPAQHSPT